MTYDPEVPESVWQAGLNWAELFGDGDPVEVDIGCGRGRFLIEAAQANPGVNYLGIEKMGKPYHVAVERITARGCPNIRILRGDGHILVGEKIPENSVRAYHIYFPDPWPKKRHHKRRIFTPPFIADLARTLVPHGTLNIATDISDYFDEIALVIDESGRFESVEEGTYDPGGYLTNFAAKYLQQGREMFRGRFVRKEPTHVDAAAD